KKQAKTFELGIRYLKLGNTFREAEEFDLSEKNLSMVEVGEQGTGKSFKVSCVEQDVVAVQKILQEAFGKQLKTYQVNAIKISSLAQRMIDITMGASKTAVIILCLSI
ncbi:MAG: hypothetical protein L3J52_08485, partial [Proteobacteria bacterium]|nr:hypothetical protein [Pseudomonadota bacterium]